MAFLKEELMAKGKIAPHEILKVHPLSLSERIAYFQGCVLATLLDDAKISQEESRFLFSLGRSLSLSDEDIVESIETVKGLTSECEQDLFLNELKSALSERPVLKYFMADFERLMQKPGGVSADAKEGLDYVGNRLVGSLNWRGVLGGEEDGGQCHGNDVVCPIGHEDGDRGERVKVEKEEVEFWLSHVGKTPMAVLSVLVAALPTAKKFPDWALGQIREVERLGVPMCLEREFDAAAAQKVIAKLRSMGADGYVRSPQSVKTADGYSRMAYEAEESRRIQTLFENESVKRLFSEWKRLCGAYCKALPTLTYQLQQAGCHCVHGIVLPRSCLKDVALKFLSECVSPSFQGRGEDEWVKDRGAVLGIFLLHCIRYPYSFNLNGEEAEDLRQIYQLAQRQSIQDLLVAHVQKYHEIEC